MKSTVNQQAVIFTQKRPLVFAIMGISVLAFVIALAFYAATGRWAVVQQGQQAHRQFQNQTQQEAPNQRNDHYIISLQNQLRDNPNNGERWYELGQAYALNNDFSAALHCFENAQKVLGERAAIFGAMASADYYQAAQKLSPQAQLWIQKALKLDPKESTSLLLLASDHFLNHRYEQAVEYWRKVLDSEDKAIDRKAIIQSINMANQLSQTQ